jgi:exodeoxyribonuclease VII small subunit
VINVTAADGAKDTGSAADAGLQAQPAGKRPSYEQARDELTELVRRLEGGGLTLEQSLQLWERGERLAAVCTDWLEGARARLAEAMAKREHPEGSDPPAPF